MNHIKVGGIYEEKEELVLNTIEGGDIEESKSYFKQPVATTTSFKVWMAAEAGKVIDYLTWTLTATAFGFAWLVSICILNGFGRSNLVCRIILTNCMKDWADSCGGNENNVMILSLQNTRATPELKKKLDYLLDPCFVNNVWCSKWSAITARYIFWTIQSRGEWTIKEAIGFEKLFTIEITGAALVALLKDC